MLRSEVDYLVEKNERKNAHTNKEGFLKPHINTDGDAVHGSVIPLFLERKSQCY